MKATAKALDMTFTVDDYGLGSRCTVEEAKILCGRTLTVNTARAGARAKIFASISRSSSSLP